MNNSDYIADRYPKPYAVNSKSPCRSELGKISCTTGLGDDVCKMCKRTAREVIEWNSYSDEQKIRINKRIEGKS